MNALWISKCLAAPLVTEKHKWTSGSREHAGGREQVARTFSETT